MNTETEAVSITLRSRKPLAPPFHRYIAKSKLMNKTCRTGDSIVIYDVVKTNPEGVVLVTKTTLFEFE